MDDTSAVDQFLKFDFRVSYSSQAVKAWETEEDDLSSQNKKNIGLRLSSLFLASDVTLNEEKSLDMRLYVPKRSVVEGQNEQQKKEKENKKRVPLWVFIHGGGWHLNNIDTYDRMMRYFGAQFGVAILGVNYRKFPHVSYRQTVNDVLFTVMYASKKIINSVDGPLANNEQLRSLIDTSKLTLIGDSGGANLITSVTHRLRDLKLELQQSEDIIGIETQILIYPALYYYPYNASRFESFAQYSKHGLILDDAVLRGMWRNYANASMETIINDRDYRYLAVLGPNEHNTRFDQLPPTIVMAAEYDMLSSESAEYARVLQQANVPVHYEVLKHTIHGGASAPVGLKAAGAIIQRGFASLDKQQQQQQQS